MRNHALFFDGLFVDAFIHSHFPDMHTHREVGRGTGGDENAGVLVSRAHLEHPAMIGDADAVKLSVLSTLVMLVNQVCLCFVAWSSNVWGVKHAVSQVVSSSKSRKGYNHSNVVTIHLAVILIMLTHSLTNSLCGILLRCSSVVFYLIV